MITDTLRTLIEQNIIAYNTPLREAVKSMDLVTLLRNCHPFDRSDFTRALYRDNRITKAEAKEFVIIL